MEISAPHCTRFQFLAWLILPLIRSFAPDRRPGRAKSTNLDAKERGRQGEYDEEGPRVERLEARGEVA